MSSCVQFGGFLEQAIDLEDVSKHGERHLKVSNKIASRNGGLIYVPVVNNEALCGQFASAAITCNLKGIEKEFWIFACPLWQFRKQSHLEPGLNLLELAVQGYSPGGKPNSEANRHVSYVFEMARLRALSFLRKNRETGRAKDTAVNIFRFVEAISSIRATDGGLDYRIFETVGEYVECILNIVTLESNGNRYEDNISMNPLGLAFWLANYQSSESYREIARFKQELDHLIN
jgi:hypothetical protein